MNFYGLGQVPGGLAAKRTAAQRHAAHVRAPPCHAVHRPAGLSAARHRADSQRPAAHCDAAKRGAAAQRAVPTSC